MIIQLATSLVFLASTLYGPATTTEQVIGFNFEKPAVVRPFTLEDYVKVYFKDDPIMAEIAKCESGYVHYGKSGNVIRGRVNKSDVGVMQINEYYHSEQAENMGFDLHTLAGNMAYAKWLYESEGVRPWKASSKCWIQSLDKTNEVAYMQK